MRPDVHPISYSKNSLTEPISEVNSQISSRRNVRMNGDCVCELFLQILSHGGDLLQIQFLSLGFLGRTLRRLPAVKEVRRQKATTPPTATPDFRALLLLQKIIEGDELKVQKPELLRLLLKDAVDRHKLLIEIAEDRQPSDGTQFL